MNLKQRKVLELLLSQLDFKLEVVDILDSGNSVGECDYAESTIRVARRVLNRNRLVAVQPYELLFSATHETCHAIRYCSCDDDDLQLASQRELLYSTEKDIDKVSQLSALKIIYRNELAVDWQAEELLKELGYWHAKMISCIIDTHMLMHRYALRISYGAHCGASISRIKGLQFPDLRKAKLDKKALARMTAFMLLHPQYTVGAPIWE